MTPEEFVTEVFRVMETPRGLEMLGLDVLAIGKMVQVQGVMDRYLDGLPTGTSAESLIVSRPGFDSVHASFMDEPPC